MQLTVKQIKKLALNLMKNFLLGLEKELKNIPKSTRY